MLIRKLSLFFTINLKKELTKVRFKSFIGWQVLMFLTLGLAGIYVIPYIHTSSVLFYEQLKALKK